MNIIFLIFLIGLSATLLTLIFIGFELHYLAWIALIPLFIVIKKSGMLKAFLFSMALGFLFNIGIQWWGLKMESFNPLNFSIGATGVAFFYGIFGLFASYFNKKYPRWNILTFPAIWVLLEYLRSHIGFLSWPLGILGYSQYSALPAIQISAFTGVYGVSFFIVTVNTVITEIMCLFLSHSQVKIFHGLSSPISLKTSLSILVGSLLVISLPFLYGSLSTAKTESIPALKVALIQGNVYWNERYWSDKYKYDSYYREGIFQKYSSLTLKAANSKPELILWPSSSVPGRIPYEKMRVKMLSSLARETGSSLLIGSSGFDKFITDQKKTRRVANSAFLFSPQGEIIGRYDKMRLLPFDEYLPMRNYVKWPSWIVSNITDAQPGEEMTIFSMKGVKFGVLICWEYMFPDQFREMAIKGVDFMVNMTNEGFTRTPVAHYQMLAMSVFRAVENNVSIARTASTGVSAIIEPDGRIRSKVHDQNLRDVDVEGYLVDEIPLSSKRTFYSRYGDWFIYTLSGIFIVFISKGRMSKLFTIRKNKNNFQGGIER